MCCRRPGSAVRFFEVMFLELKKDELLKLERGMKERRDSWLGAGASAGMLHRHWALPA